MTELVAALLDPMLDPASRTFWPALVSGALVAAASGGLGLARFASRSGRVDLQLLALRQLLGALGWVPRLGSAAGWAVGTVAVLDAVAPRPAWDVSGPLLCAAWSVALFVAWDASRWALHRAMHAVPVLWAFHQVHHSAPALTPLTFHRVHPVESALYALRGVVITGTLAGVAHWAFGGRAVEWELLGVSGIGLLLNVATGSLRHSHVWLRFPAAVERWLLSPAQHQLHHADDPAGQQRNFGTWLAIWDRLAGTWAPAPAAPPAAFGVVGANHDPGDALSALWGPVRAALPARVAAAAGLLPAVAVAADPADAAEEALAYEVIVDADERQVVHEAGSAHVITEEELARHDYDDIHRILAAVPGVYVRGEDGYGLRPNIGMRGGSADRSAKVTLLEDGVPMAPGPYASPAAYYFPMPMRFVGVEVFKGPSAVRFGPQTVGGTINVLTRPVPTSSRGAVDLDAGSFGTVSAHAWGALANDEGGLLLEGASLGTQGFKTLPDGGPTGFLRQDLMAKTRLAGGGAATPRALELKLGWGRERSYETYLGLAPADARRDPYQRYAASAHDRMDWQRTQAELSFTAAGDHHDLRVVAWHHGLARAWRKVNEFRDGPALSDLLLDPGDGAAAVYLELLHGTIDASDPSEQLMIGTNDRRFGSGGVLVVAHHRAAAPGVTHALELGLKAEIDEARRVHTQDPYWLVQGRPVPVDGGERELLLDSATRAMAVAPHLAEDLALGPVHLQPGARLEVMRVAAGTTGTGPVGDRTIAQLLPGFGVLGTALGAIDLFAGVHRGFSPAPPEADPAQRPEGAWSAEAGARLYPGRAHLEAIGFWSDYSEITGVCTLAGGCDPASFDAQFNGGAATVAGLEALAAQEVSLGADAAVRAQASWTYTRATFDTGFASAFPQWGVVEAGDALPYVPAHQGALALSGDHPAGGGSVTARYRGAMRDVAGQGPIDGPTRVPPLFLVDLAGRLRVAEGVAATATATNLLGSAVTESFRPFGARPTAPRTILFGVRAGAW